MKGKRKESLKAGSGKNQRKIEQERERERVKAEHHDCKSWLNFSRSVASIT